MLYVKYVSLGGGKAIHRIAKAKETANRDLRNILLLRDKVGTILTRGKDFGNQWKEYFEG